MISCRVNGPSRRSAIGRDTGAKEQEQGCNVAFEIWLMTSTKKKHSGPAKITILYFYPNSRLRGWFLEIAGTSVQRLLEICLALQIHDAIDEQG
jgi:hypothetical protein